MDTEDNLYSKLGLETVRRLLEPMEGGKYYRVVNAMPALTDSFV